MHMHGLVVILLVDLPILGWLISIESTHEFVIVPAEKKVAVLKFTVNRNSSLNTQKDRQTDKHAIVLKSYTNPFPHLVVFDDCC